MSTENEGNLSPDDAERVARKAATPFIGPPKTPDQIFVEEIFNRKEQIRKEVVEEVMPVVLAGGLHKDPAAFKMLCARAYLERFGKWEKEQLLYLIVHTATQATVENLR